VPVAGKIVVGAANLAQNLVELKEASAEGDEILEITEAGLRGQERLIAKVKARLDASNFRLQLLTRFNSEIAARCPLP
jgi:hypothetical protein